MLSQEWINNNNNPLFKALLLMLLISKSLTHSGSKVILEFCYFWNQFSKFLLP